MISVKGTRPLTAKGFGVTQARADILQASLAETQAQLVEVQQALRLLQSENKQLLRESVVARAQAQACTRPPPRHLTWQVPLVPLQQS